MQRWEGIKSLTLSSGIGNAKSAHKNTRWKCSWAATKPALLLHPVRVYSPRCPRSSRRLFKHRCDFQGGQVPSVSGSPLFTPHLGTPLLQCPSTPGPRGKPREAWGQAARWDRAEPRRYPWHSPAAWWNWTWLNPGFRELRRSSGTSHSQDVCLPATAPGWDEAAVGCRGCRRCRGCRDGDASKHM